TECLQCVDGSISPPEIQQFIPEYVKKLTSPECPNATLATNATKVIFGQCPNDPTDQQKNRCGTLSGSVKLSLKSLGAEATLTFFLRDCFAVNKNTESGCSTDQNTLNDQKAIFEKKFGDDLKTLGVEVGDIQNGEFCIKNDGTECLQYVYGSINPPEVRNFIPDYVKTLSSPECSNATAATTSTDVIFGPCANDPTDDRINRCGTLRGSVKLSASSFGETKATVRECFAVNKNTEYGCSTDQNALNDQKTILEKKFVNALKTLGVKFGDIQNGEFCIKNDGTNKSGTLMFLSMWLLIMLMLAPIIV
ncbi:Hypothetical predicted protein, partial [Mytilus galloprovincialis]